MKLARLLLEIRSPVQIVGAKVSSLRFFARKRDAANYNSSLKRRFNEAAFAAYTRGINAAVSRSTFTERELCAHDVDDKKYDSVFSTCKTPLRRVIHSKAEL